MNGPIRWTDNPNRIISLFVSEHERRFTIRYINVSISFNALDEDGPTDDIKKRIGEILAGKPLETTEKLLQKEFCN